MEKLEKFVGEKIFGIKPNFIKNLKIWFIIVMYFLLTLIYVFWTSFAARMAEFRSSNIAIAFFSSIAALIYVGISFLLYFTKNKKNICVLTIVLLVVLFIPLFILIIVDIAVGR